MRDQRERIVFLDETVTTTKIARLLEGEAMTDLCEEFGISRKTGYKIYERCKQNGSEALTDRSRRPWRYANQCRPA